MKENKKMMLKSLWISLLVWGGMSACSESLVEPAPSEDETMAEAVYMQFDLKLPTATRSITDSEGNSNSDATPDTEVGSNAENTVASVSVVLATQTTDAATGVTSYAYVAKSSNPKLTGAGTEYTVTFEADDLINYLNQNLAVFVLCNPATGFNPENVFTTGDKASITADARILCRVFMPAHPAS